MSVAWKAGTAATIITPSEPMWLAGWAVRRQPAASTSLDLFAKALALEDDEGQRAVIVTTDLIAIPRRLARNVAAKIQAQWGLPRERLLFNASHTHTGPEVRPDKVPFFDIPPEFAAKIEPFVSDLENKFVELIASALASLRPAILSVRETAAGFTQNRRAADGPVDRAVPVLEVTGMAREPLAIIFGYACHNLTLPPTFCRFHGDYAGVAQQRLENAFPGSRAFFLSGAGADLDPHPRGTVEHTEQHGQTLADAVQDALAQPGRPVSGPLRTRFEEVALDFAPLPPVDTLESDAASEDGPRARKATFLLQALRGGRRFPTSYPCPVQVFKLGGELLLIALGGEPVAGYSLQFKAEFKVPLVWVAGYCNDGFGYLPNRNVLGQGGYEGGRSLFWSELPAPFTETVEERLIGVVRKLIQSR